MIKLSKKASASRSYDWRPNFRNYDELPDIRAVRTQFFVPTMAIAIASIFSVYILFQEYRAMNIGENIQTLEADIGTYEARHDEKVKLNSEFMAIANTMDEVVEFESDNLVASDFILTISSLLLDGMHLDRVDYLGERAVIEGSVLVSAEQASRLVNSYMKSIEDADALQGLLSEYKLITLDRVGLGNAITFRIEITKTQGETK